MGVATAPTPDFPWQPAQFSAYRVVASRIESGRGTNGPGLGLPGKLSQALVRKMSSARVEMVRARFILPGFLFQDSQRVRGRDEPATALRASALRGHT